MSNSLYTTDGFVTYIFIKVQIVVKTTQKRSKENFILLTYLYELYVNILNTKLFTMTNNHSFEPLLAMNAERDSVFIASIGIRFRGTRARVPVCSTVVCPTLLVNRKLQKIQKY